MNDMIIGELLNGRTTLKEAVRRFERDCVLAAIDVVRDDKRAAARLLGISLASLYRKLDLEGSSEPEPVSQD